MNHLTPAEIVEAADGTLAQARRAHLDACEPCRSEVAELGGLLTAMHRVEVPDPSPLFWDHFSRRVTEALAAEPAAPPRATRWFSLPVLAPLGALALMLLALGAAVPQGELGILQARLAVASPWRGPAGAPVAQGAIDEEWLLMTTLVGELDLDTARQAGLAGGPGAADRVVLQLTSSESQELLRLLREELQRAGG